MHRYIEEHRTHVEITGFRDAEFERAESFLKANRSGAPNGMDLQFFDASLIATWEHLYFATLNALTAFMNKTNISKSVAVEMMLFTAAQRQIQKSIAKIGIKPQTTTIAVVIIGADVGAVARMFGEVSVAVGGQLDDSVLELNAQKTAKIRDVFGIFQKELEAATRNGTDGALVDLVVERMALLATQL